MKMAEPATNQVVDLDRLTVVRERLKELADLYTARQAASDQFTEAIKTVATKANLDSQVLKQYVTARERDKMDEYHARAE